MCKAALTGFNSIHFVLLRNFCSFASNQKLKINMDLKKILAGSFVAMLTLGATLQAQVRQQPNQQQQQPQMQMQQQAPQTDVSEKELKKFVSIAQDIQEAQNGVEEEMIAILKKNNLNVEKFQMIQQAQQMPGEDGELPDGVSQEDMQNFTAAMSEIQQKQQENQEKMMEVISEGGMEMQRFQEIQMALQQDQELQQRFRTMME